MRILYITLAIFFCSSHIDAQTWDSVGTGMNYDVYGLAVYNGELYAAGSFSLAGGNPSSRIASWNGTRWSAVGAGISNGGAGTLTVYNNDLYASGGANNITFWNGTSWGSVPTSNGGPTSAMAVYNGELYVGGPATGIRYDIILEFNGTGWSTVGSGINYNSNVYPGVFALGVYNGILFAGGNFSVSGGSIANNVATWDGTSWASVGAGMDGTVLSFAIYNGELYAAGLFSHAGGNTANCIAKWNGTSWSAVGTGLNNYVYSLAVYNGELYAGGAFTKAGGNPANRVAKWNGSTWSNVGAGIDSTVESLCVYNGDLYAGGLFTSAGGKTVNRIAELDTAALSSISEMKTKASFSVYPNPVMNNMHVVISSNSTNPNLTIYNALGDCVCRRLITSLDFQMNISDLAEGIYFIQLSTANGIETKKVVVQR